MSNITLAVTGLRKTIRGKKIIKGIDFQLRQGEVFGFLGPNGAGKTTTIRMIVGLIKPTAGKISICNYDIEKDFSKAMENLGCIVENPELYPYLTGWENLELLAAMMANVEKNRLHEVVQLVGLAARIHDKVKTYSLGMKQRLGIAQALLGKPKVLILDEPTNGLDPSGIREIRELIKFLAITEGLSVFISSHLLSEIQLMCDRVAIISKGKVVQVSEVAHLLSQQQQAIWSVSSIKDALTVFSMLHVNAEQIGEAIITPYSSSEIGTWNRKLVESGIIVTEISRKVPTLEELFLALTGGEAID